MYSTLCVIVICWMVEPEVAPRQTDTRFRRVASPTSDSPTLLLLSRISTRALGSTGGMRVCVWCTAVLKRWNRIGISPG